MSVFTIYCHGSGGHRDKPDKEIVAYMGRRAVGTEYKDYLILDGVGGEAPGKNNPNPMAGTFNWADRNKSSNAHVGKEMGGAGTSIKSTIKNAFLSKPVIANLAGHGVEDNARHAIVTIANLQTLPDTINLVGWSRGAVTCLVIANMLYDPSTTEGLFRGIKVNIFAIDPVAGMEAGIGADSESRRLIPPSVKNYVGILASGENRNTFSPQDLSRVRVVDKAASNVIFLPMPGKHSTVAQDNDPKGILVSDICFNLAHRFFEKFGSRQSAGPARPMMSDAMLEAYSTILVESGQYNKIKQKGAFQFAIGKGFGQREFAKKPEEYTQNSAYFINEHHRVLFESTCPNLYSWLFTRATALPGLTSKVVPAGSPHGQEVARAWGSAPNLVQTLEKLGVEREGSNVRLPGPGSAADPRQINDIQASGSMRSMGLL
ncbi:MAG: DUF5621 domain-containing protein [bacterium]|nr:DUF5621 domain-containing protein [bacterium]